MNCVVCGMRHDSPVPENETIGACEFCGTLHIAEDGSWRRFTADEFGALSRNSKFGLLWWQAQVIRSGSSRGRSQ